MSLPIHLTFKYYKDMMVFKVLLDQLVYLKDIGNICKFDSKGNKRYQDHKDLRDQEMEVWSLLDGDVPPVL